MEKNDKLEEYKKKILALQKMEEEKKKRKELGRELLVVDSKAFVNRDNLPKTIGAFMKLANITKVQEDFRKVKTIEQAIKVKAPSFALLKKKYGKEETDAYIRLWIILLNESINVKRGLTEYQIGECARIILEEFYTLTIVDINIIFKNAILGAFGPLYEALSIDKILSWFNAYYNKRLEIAEDMAMAESDKNKYYEEKGERVSTDAKEEIREAVKKYKVEQIFNKFDKDIKRIRE